MSTTLWEQLEDETITLTGGRPTKASGRLAEKGDVRTPTLLIECKHRTVKALKYAATLNVDWFDTTKQHADDAEKIPIVVVGVSCSQSEAIDFKLSFSLEQDIALFEIQGDTGPFRSIPDGWLPITEQSLQNYCILEEQAVQGESKDKVVSSKMGSNQVVSGKCFSRGRPMSGNRPMNTGPSRWKR